MPSECFGTWSRERYIGEASEIMILTCDGCGWHMAVTDGWAEDYKPSMTDEAIFRAIVRGD